MNGLIPINYNNDTPTVLGRDLHAMLEVETPYHKWFPRMKVSCFSAGTADQYKHRKEIKS